MASENAIKVLGLVQDYADSIGTAGLTEWEQTFLDSMLARWERYGDDVNVSPKQFASLERILKKYEGDR